jgi:hypothetical protein
MGASRRAGHRWSSARPPVASSAPAPLGARSRPSAAARGPFPAPPLASRCAPSFALGRGIPGADTASGEFVLPSRAVSHHRHARGGPQNALSRCGTPRLRAVQQTTPRARPTRPGWDGGPVGRARETQQPPISSRSKNCESHSNQTPQKHSVQNTTRHRRKSTLRCTSRSGHRINPLQPAGYP